MLSKNKIILIIGSIIWVFTSAFFFYSENDILFWSKDLRLTWDNFKGPVPQEDSHHARSYCKINCTYKVVSDSLNISITTSFSVNKSWAKAERTDDLLNHEQRHFDVEEIYSRKFRQYAARWKGVPDIGTYLKTGNDSIGKECTSFQDKYDTETDHSKKQTAQKKWNKKIDSLLTVYSSYENSLVKIPYRKK